MRMMLKEGLLLSLLDELVERICVASHFGEWHLLKDNGEEKCPKCKDLCMGS